MRRFFALRAGIFFAGRELLLRVGISNADMGLL
jgi:hypothetical protein